jgi:geranylgeranyl diphosphate synthase, type I
MLPDGLDGILRDEVEILLASLSDNAFLCDLVKEALNKTNPVLIKDTARYKPWPLLPLLVCDAICGNWEQALPVTAALQLMKAAADVFDDIEDADNTGSVPAKYGIALATNTASVLVVLAEKGFTRLQHGSVNSDTVVKLIGTVNSYYAKACIGQHLDLSLSPEERKQEEGYLKLIGMKSAFAAECACHTGALLAGANQELIVSFSLFGYNLGMAAQIANDIRGITGLRDIDNRKITLPVIFALAHADEPCELLKSAFLKNKGELKIDPCRIKDLLVNTGAIQYALTKMEIYKQQATDILNELERKGIKIKPLRQFLD